MKGFRPITNPMLVGAIELMKSNSTTEHRKMVIEEMLHAHFLSPVVITPKPEPDENGIAKMSPDAKISVPMLTAPDGKHFFMAFTDIEELQKWKKEEGQQIFGFSFADYVKMVRTAQDNCQGFVLNPYSHNLVLTRDMIETIAEHNPQIFKTEE